jgi:hypothetical protein
LAVRASRIFAIVSLMVCGDAGRGIKPPWGHFPPVPRGFRCGRFGFHERCRRRGDGSPHHSKR